MQTTSHVKFTFPQSQQTTKKCLKLVGWLAGINFASAKQKILKVERYKKRGKLTVSCELHFKNSDIIQGASRKIVKHGAVPIYNNNQVSHGDLQ